MQSCSLKLNNWIIVWIHVAEIFTNCSPCVLPIVRLLNTIASSQMGMKVRLAINLNSSNTF